jgi:serine/threonine-protein kinase
MIGSRLGSWIIEAEIGRGGMGAVYRARRFKGEGPATAAIKVLAAELAIEPGFQQRFQREIDILRQLDHPGIVRFYESGQTGPRFWYAMELVDGPSFESLRDERGRVSWPEVLELALQIAPALKHAHDRGVIHRDLKPGNVLRAPSADDPEGPGVIKLTDFGIASLFASPHLTVTGGIIGTPEYLSPEQAAGKSATKRSDLYSLGIVLYALVTGSTPFTGEPLDLLHKHRYAQFDRPGRIVSELPHGFDEIICQLLEKDPDKRIPDAGVLFRRLDSLRRKLIRQAQHSSGEATGLPAQRDTPGGDIGPATLASQVVRQHLEDQKRGGPVSQVFNHPIILASLFGLCLGILVWTFWPMSEATLYARGEALMQSDDPDDWERAWEQYFAPLQERFPDHAHKEEVAAFKERVDAHRAERGAALQAKLARPLPEARWFFEQGRRQREANDEAAARKTWQALIDAYAHVPAAKPWVQLARKEMEGHRDDNEGHLAAVRAALKEADKLGRDEAKKVRAALRKLYADDRPALRLIGKD